MALSLQKHNNAPKTTALCNSCLKSVINQTFVFRNTSWTWYLIQILLVESGGRQADGSFTIAWLPWDLNTKKTIYPMIAWSFWNIGLETKHIDLGLNSFCIFWQNSQDCNQVWNCKKVSFLKIFTLSIKCRSWHESQFNIINSCVEAEVTDIK